MRRAAYVPAGGRYRPGPRTYVKRRTRWFNRIGMAITFCALAYLVALIVWAGVGSLASPDPVVPPRPPATIPAPCPTGGVQCR